MLACGFSQLLISRGKPHYQSFPTVSLPGRLPSDSQSGSLLNRPLNLPIQGDFLATANLNAQHQQTTPNQLLMAVCPIILKIKCLWRVG
jgi:hypothetical protein